MPETTTCLVVGGGPAGMVLGLLLARAGIDVTVLEKHADFLRDFRGDTVHPSTLTLLDELGLGERFAQLPQSHVSQVSLPQPNGQPLVVGNFDRLPVAHPYIAMVPQWDLLGLLADEARREPTFTLRMQTEVTGFLRESGRVVGVTYRTAHGQTGEVRASLTVACDGRWSVAHSLPELRPREMSVPIDAWWFRLPRRPEDDAPALMPFANRGGFAVVVPRTDYFQIAFVGPKGEDARLRARGIEDFRREVAALMPPLADRVDALTSMDDVKFLDVRLNRLRRWHVDGLVCIGDAAHAMSPVGGVGINLAVQDAVGAATVLAEPLRRRGQVPSRALARVRRRRLVSTVAVQTLQRLLHTLVVQPILEGRRTGPPRSALTVVQRFPALTLVPAYLIGVGLRPEHAPDFARRAPEVDASGEDRHTVSVST